MPARLTQGSKKIAPKRKAPRTPLEDVFQALILREVLLADGLKADLQVARVAPWLGHLLAKPVQEPGGS